MNYIYTAVISRDEDKYIASVPDFPGCMTSGNSVSDAIDQITDALSVCLVTSEDKNLPIPVPTAQSELPHGSNDIYTLIRIDTLAYRAATDKRSVRKNVSLPAWMAALADKRGLNCSKILQDALLNILS